MTRTVAIGIQDFGDLIKHNCFYVDKTPFIKEWWESRDSVTLITRPRRFGKTLNMSMLEYFFSVEYEKYGFLFQGLSIWEDEEYRKLQGTYPVINLSFANIKENNYESARKKICQIMISLYAKYSFLLEGDLLYDTEKAYFRRIKDGMDDTDATMALHHLSDYLYRYYGKKVIILLDEYDTPMQEAYVHGYWDDLVSFTRGLFNSTFKTNPRLERAIMTGITRVSKESIFSDLNNLEVVTTTSDKYAEAFGFNETEVFEALDECLLSDYKSAVKKWYDGFVFGEHRDIYNPWSILNFIDKRRFAAYWANTSSNSLVGKLLREGHSDVKIKFEKLLFGESIETAIDEQIVYNQLNGSEYAIWSLLLASGYLKVDSYESLPQDIPWWKPKYILSITNYEVKQMFQNMIHDWFVESEKDYNDFVKAMLQGNLQAMNAYMNRVALCTFSYFDAGNRPSGEEPERFYHGFVLGLIVELSDRYIITSNRESGFGRYDVILEPKDTERDDAIILEFKVLDSYNEKTLEETVQNALKQIEDMQYAVQLMSKGIPKDRIKSYGFAFRGKQVLIDNREKKDFTKNNE